MCWVASPAKDRLSFGERQGCLFDWLDARSVPFVKPIASSSICPSDMPSFVFLPGLGFCGVQGRRSRKTHHHAVFIPVRRIHARHTERGIRPGRQSRFGHFASRVLLRREHRKGMRIRLGRSRAVCCGQVNDDVEIEGRERKRRVIETWCRRHHPARP